MVHEGAQGAVDASMSDSWAVPHARSVWFDHQIVCVCVCSGMRVCIEALVAHTCNDSVAEADKTILLHLAC